MMQKTEHQLMEEVERTQRDVNAITEHPETFSYCEVPESAEATETSE